MSLSKESADSRPVVTGHGKLRIKPDGLVVFCYGLFQAPLLTKLDTIVVVPLRLT